MALSQVISSLKYICNALSLLLQMCAQSMHGSFTGYFVTEIYLQCFNMHGSFTGYFVTEIYLQCFKSSATNVCSIYACSGICELSLLYTKMHSSDISIFGSIIEVTKGRTMFLCHISIGTDLKPSRLSSLNCSYLCSE